MFTYIFAVRLDRRPSGADIDALTAAAAQGAARVSRDDRYAVLLYTRTAPTLSHAIATTVAEITRIPGLHPWWFETYDQAP